MALGNDVSTVQAGVEFCGNDTTVAILRMEGGATAKISANFSCVHPHFHAFVVYGTEGTLRNTAEGLVLQDSRDPESAPVLLAPAHRPQKGDLISPFINAILDGDPGPVPEGEIFDAMRVGLAIDEAAASETVVEIETLAGVVRHR